ncbi:MAG: hypothetical protein H7175_08910 [Burkholderiales bacterium]|nr:hypothetical protein [Anaerolineae bacterium]
MSDYRLTIPEEVFTRAKQIAEETSQPVEQVLIDYLRTLSPLVPPLPPDEDAELRALEYLSDDALWTLSQERMAGDLSYRMEVLMDKNSLGTITPQEYNELEKLVERGQKLMVRKSEAMALLGERGWGH